MTGENELPLAQRSDADLPGYWLNARIGKRVLRPGGVELTSRLSRLRASAARTWWNSAQGWGNRPRYSRPGAEVLRGC